MLSVPVQRQIGADLAAVLDRAKREHGATGADCVQFLFAVAYAEAERLGQSHEQIAAWALRAIDSVGRAFRRNGAG